LSQDEPEEAGGDRNENVTPLAKPAQVGNARGGETLR